MLNSAHPTWWPVAVMGALVALAGVTTIMPRGTTRLRRGTPAALGAMLFFATGYFGADSLITVLLTDGYGTSLAQAAIVLSAAPLAWAVAGIGVGLAYPSLYIICTSTDESIGFGAVELATAVITAEAFGGLFGRAAGGAITSLNGTAGLAQVTGLSTAYSVFGLFLFAAVIAATRSTLATSRG